MSENETAKAKGPWVPRTNLAGLQFVADSIELLKGDKLSTVWAQKLQHEVDHIKSGERVLYGYADPWEFLGYSQV